MVLIDELHEQNHQIAELAKILSYLFQDREMCDADVTSELFVRYRDQFYTHMSNNRAIYSSLLTDSRYDSSTYRFMEGEKELKKIFRRYQTKWCKNGLHIGDHKSFKRETEDMFKLVRQRIQAETEQLYPLVRRLEAGA